MANDIEYATKVAVPSLKELGYYNGSSKKGCWTRFWWRDYGYAASQDLDYSLGTTYEYFSGKDGAECVIMPVQLSNNQSDDKRYFLRDVYFDITDDAPMFSDSHGYLPAPSYTSNDGVYYFRTYDNNEKLSYPSIYHSSNDYINLIVIIRF